MANQKFIYVEIKDKKTSQGISAGGVVFNNRTVAAFENELPNDVKMRVNQNVLALTTEKAYKAWVASQDEAAENKKKQNAIKKGYADKKANEALERTGKEPKAKEPNKDDGSETPTVPPAK